MAEPRLFSQPAALGGSVEFAVEIALGQDAGGEGVALWAPFDPATPGIITFDAVASTPHVVAAAFPIADLDGGFDITGTFRIGSGNLDQARLINAWTSASGQRSFTLHWSLNGSVRFALASGGSSINLDSDAIYFAGVEHTFHAVHRPGQFSTLTVDGDLYTSLVTVGTLDLNPEPLTAGTRSDLLEPRTNDFWIQNLVLLTVAGADAEVAVRDVGNGPLDGVAWTDAFSTDWLGVGDVVASGFGEGTDSLWDIGLWSGQQLSWVDITSRAQAANTKRGRDRWEQQFRVGQSTVKLDNQDGVFNPDSGRSPGAVSLRPGRWLRVLGRRTDDGSDWVPVWTGQIDGMADRYTAGAQGIDSIFASLDFGARFQIDDPPALESPIPPGQLTGDRVNQLLDLVDWPENPEVTEAVPQGLVVPDLTVGAGDTVVEGDAITVTFLDEGRWRDIDQGLHTMTESNLPQSRWAEMQVAATAEGGAMFISAYGVPTFRDRDWLTDKLAAGVPKFTVGAVASDIKVLGADTDWSQQRVYGDVQMARKGTTDEVVRRVSDDSIALYGPRTFSRFDIECETENQLVALVERFLASAQFDRSRLESIDLVPTTADGITQLLEAEVGDLIRVTIQTDGVGQWSYTDDYFVQKVTHQITDEDWVTSLRIDAATFDVPLLPAAYTEGFDDGFDSQDPD